MAYAKSILLVSYDDSRAAARAEFFEENGLPTFVASSLYEAMRSLDFRPFDLVIAGTSVERRDVRELLDRIRELRFEGAETKFAMLYKNSLPIEFPADAFINVDDDDSAFLATVSLLLFRQVRMPKSDKRQMPKPPKLAMPKPPKPPTVPKPGPFLMPKPPRVPQQPKPPRLRVPRPPKRG